MPDFITVPVMAGSVVKGASAALFDRQFCLPARRQIRNQWKIAIGETSPLVLALPPGSESDGFLKRPLSDGGD